MVGLREYNLPPTDWRLGRIHAMTLEPAGSARVTDIQTAQGIIPRPIVKLTFHKSYLLSSRIPCQLVLIQYKLIFYLPTEMALNKNKIATTSGCSKKTWMLSQLPSSRTLRAHMFE